MCIWVCMYCTICNYDCPYAHMGNIVVCHMYALYVCPYAHMGNILYVFLYLFLIVVMPICAYGLVYDCFPIYCMFLIVLMPICAYILYINTLHTEHVIRFALIINGDVSTRQQMDAVLFLQEFCLVTKNFQAPQKHQFYTYDNRE